MSRTEEQMRAIEKGAYVLRDCDGTPDAIIIGTGTEVELAMKAAEQLSAKGRKVRVVSMPSMDTFDAQDAAYKESVLPDAVKARVAVEAGVSNLWPKYVGMHGKIIGVDRFGESAPAPAVYKEFGVTAEAVAEAVDSLL
jgi:transketolase